MIRSTSPALLTLALMISGTAALCQKTDPPARADEGKKETPATQLPQRVNGGAEGALSYFASLKHTPDVPMLRRTLDLDLHDSTIRQAAVAISRASGVAIRVDDNVPKDARLNVTAQKIPMTTLLEAIAKQTEISIVPDGQGIL